MSIHFNTVLKRSLAAAFCLGMAFSATGCASQSSANTTAPADGGATVRIAYLSTANYLTTLRNEDFVASTMSPDSASFSGPFNPPSDAFQAVQSGQADASSTGTGHFLRLISQDTPWVAFAIEYYDGDSQGIVAAPGSGVKSLKDLYGKSIAIDKKGATGDYIVKAAFSHAGLDYTKVNEVEMSQTDFAAAFASGQVDALASYDQNLASAIATEGATLLVTGKDYDSKNVSIHMVSSTFAKEHPDTVKRLYNALVKESQRAQQDPSFIYDTYREFGASDSLIDQVRKFDVPTIKPIDADGKALLAAQAQQYVDFGFIDAIPDIDAHTIDCSK
ncbi:ABC transporter substrate-binding protein [Bifidobacterium tsurumiense]|uniref:ABC transporter substrate-binding protein n=1 Tax=Bifidobacterium tsurumiense TaxID=356829 RepID=UPI00042626F5|nr:NrtA/SsuA/CpmA family ABC transporter substrate-binding protein [Bifidobacterium tsurumiense]